MHSYIPTDLQGLHCHILLEEKGRKLKCVERKRVRDTVRVRIEQLEVGPLLRISNVT